MASQECPTTSKVETDDEDEESDDEEEEEEEEEDEEEEEEATDSEEEGGSWIVQLSPKCNHKCPYKSEARLTAEGNLTLQ